jgi:hypothetical protein
MDKSNGVNMSEIRRLAGISQDLRLPVGSPLPNMHGKPSDYVANTARSSIREHVSPGERCRAQYQRELSEGTIKLYDSPTKLREGVQQAMKLVQRALATIQCDSDRFRGRVGSMNEKARADIYRADQELVTALESIHAAAEAIEAIELAKRAWAKEGRANRNEKRSGKR